MTDHELLELAAKAAGIPVVPCTCSNPKWPFKHDEAKSGKRGHWNPLVDDGDALRLAVKLRLNFSDKVLWLRHNDQEHYDPYAATRRVIVRAAAGIGNDGSPFPTEEEIRENWI